MGRIHVIGAGMAGLACAVQLARAGRDVVVHEAAPRAGGRCRSFHDDKLDRVIDNGNHLLLSGNREALTYLEAIGARHRLTAPVEAAFPFVDLASGERWCLRPNAGRLPWWVASRGRRVAGGGALAHLRGMRLAFASEDESVAACLRRPGDPLWPRLWVPLSEAILNTEPEHASARLLGRVFLETFGRGGEACRPLTAIQSLSDTFVEPALAALDVLQAEVHVGRRLRRLEIVGESVAALDFGETRVALDAEDRVVLAVPAPTAARLLPGLEVPEDSRAIVNAHIRLPHRARLPRGIPFLGLIGGTAQWLFLRQDVASITVSAANGLIDEAPQAIAEQVWRDTATALNLDPRLRPAMRVVKEKRATFAQTPAMLRRRPPPRTALANLLLAGDWTDTGLPATIEGAVRSGHQAARLVVEDGG